MAAASWQPDPSANDVGTTLLKYLRLIVGTEKMGLESVVDDMVIHLFAALGFNAGRLLILSVLQWLHKRRWRCFCTVRRSCSRVVLSLSRFTCRSKNTLKFTMNKDSTCEATADVTVYDVANKVRLAVVEVSCSNASRTLRL